MTISSVIKGEIITPDWGNSVADAINNLPLVGGGTFSGTTNITTSALTVTHGLGWVPTSVIVQPALPNGVLTSDRFVSATVTAITSTTFTIGRCIAQDGSLLTNAPFGVSVSGFWMAFKEA